MTSISSLLKIFFRSFSVYGLLFLLISSNQLVAPFTVKTQDSQWSIPQTVPGYDPETWPPILIADQNRTVHAFSSQWIEVENNDPVRAIVYNHWTLAQGWTSPTDIILSPSKEARITNAYLDKNGIFHIVFFGGDNTGANIYYSKAPVTQANDARAWSTPIVIGENAGDPEGAVLIEGMRGELNVVFNGRDLGNGLNVVKSTDGGQTWSDPTPIFLTLTDEPNITDLQIIRSKSGVLHAIWAVKDAVGQGRGIYYSKSENGNHWSEPLLLADAKEDLGTQVPTIIEYNDTLFVLYINHTIGGANKIIMQRSVDDGKTWDVPSIVFHRHEGVNGSLSLVTDGNNELHLFFGQRIPGSPEIHGMWHSVFQNNHWVEPEAVVKGPLFRDPDNKKGFDPYQARAIVSQGNVLLVTWRTDPAAGPNGVWYSYREINVPGAPVVELPTVSGPTSDPNSTHDLSAQSTPASTIQLPVTSENNSENQVSTNRLAFLNNPSLPIILGCTTALIAISFVAIIRRSTLRK